MPAAGDGLDGPRGELEALRRRIAELEAAQARRVAVLEAIRVLGAEAGVGFCGALVLELTKLLGVRYALVGEFEGTRVRTLAHCAEGRIAENVEYDIVGTPCATVLSSSDICSFPRGVQGIFPSDVMLADLGIESYAGAPLLDAPGRPLGIVSVFDKKPLGDEGFVASILRIVAVRATTELERVRAERALRASEARKAAIVESALDAIVSIDHLGRILDFNPAAEQMFGSRQADVLGRELAEVLVPPPLREAHRRGLERCVATGEGPIIGKRIEMSALRADGTEFPVEIVVVRGASESPPPFIGFVRDITERKGAEARLRESETKYRNLVEASSDLIWSTDLEGRFTFVNEAARRIYGYAPAELIGRSFLETVIRPGLRAQAGGVFGKLLAGASYVQAEVEHRRRDGSPVHLLGTAAVLKDGDGLVIGVTGTATDISERKRAEEALRRSEERLRQIQKMEAIGRLAGGVAHDFNNRLLVILGCSERIRRRLGEGDPVAWEAGMIVKAAEAAASLTRQLLAFSRKQVFEPTALDLGAVAADMEALLRRVLGEDIELRVSRKARDLVLADRAQVEQVILNLAVNARDAMPRGGKLTIETADADIDAAFGERAQVRAGRYVLLSVTDSGVGMDAQTLAHVFEPFFTTKEVGKGTGLGLSTVYGVVKQSGGHVTVYSEPGRGTTFKVYLPRTEDRAVSPAGRAEAPPPRTGGAETILLVEDNELVRELTCTELEEIGYRVLAARGAEEALEVAERHEGPIHLVLTDIVMPRMTGRELADRLTRVRPGSKVLYMSAYTDEAVVHHGVLQPGTPVLQTPFTAEALAAKIRDLLPS